MYIFPPYILSAGIILLGMFVHDAAAGEYSAVNRTQCLSLSLSVYPSFCPHCSLHTVTHCCCCCCCCLDCCVIQVSGRR